MAEPVQLLGMGNPKFNTVVVLFWLATMSWLVVAKILPPLRVGEPPNYASILNETRGQVPVCWRIEFKDRPLGWAASRISRRKDGIVDWYSRVYLNELPLEEVVPGWLGNVLRPMLEDLQPLDVDKRSRLVFDPLGRLVSFDSKVRVADVVDAIKLQGQVEGSLLRLTAQSGEISYPLERYLPQDALITDELSPQVSMPGLRVGQSWTVPLYSPFRPPNSPLEILQAEVEREDTITWGDRRVKSRVIVYRNDSGSGVSGDRVRGRAWVAEDGTVLQQEVIILKSRLKFVRQTDERANKLIQSLGEDWMANLPSKTARRMHEQLQAPAGD